ncbi:MAG: hypothetical protein WCR52_18085 [Bacteroidota bacterium]
MLNAPNTVLNCIIIDKSQAVRNDLARFCNKNDQLSLCGTYESLNSAQKECNYAVDLVLLDWDDDNANDLGFFSQQLGEPAFIFTGKNKDTAIAAFEYSAIDFLKKPIGLVRFEQAIAKVLKYKKSASNHAELSQSKASDHTQLHWNIIQLLLTKSNRLTYQIFEYANQVMHETERTRITNTALLQLYNNQQLALALKHNNAYFTKISMVNIELVMQDAMTELEWFAYQKGIKFQYLNKCPEATTPANPKIFSLLLAQIMAIMIRAAPTESDINIDIQMAHHDLTIGFHNSGLTLDEVAMEKINGAISPFESNDLNAFEHIKEGALIHYFLERMDAEVFTESVVGKGISIQLSFEGRI